MAGKKDIVEQALKLIAGGGEKAARTGIKAYHSSPHDFDKFDLSKIGTGEGNQVYGRGLYFAESPAVSGQGGDYWRQFWNKMKSGSEATAANAMWANKFDRDKAISSVERQARYYRDLSKPGKYGNGPDVEEGNRLLAEEYERALELLRDGGIVGPRTYEVNIETTPDKLIDWDKPALKQPDNVLSTIKPFYESIPERKQYGETFTGGDLYRDFVKRSGGVMHSPKIDAAGIPEVLPGGSEERATRFLASKGVPGLQYLDGISRKYGDGTRNYVIFDDKIVDIEKKYEDGGAVREGYSGKGRVVGDIVEQALKLITGAGEEAVPKAIRAYHVSPHDFDVFKPSEFRGSTFFSSTPERARRGAEAGRNEMVMETSTELPPVNWRTYEVEIDPSRIKGLSLTPSENKWFEALPGKIVGDDALKEATKGIPQGMYWDDFYDETPISEGVYEYTKKSSPPSMSYEEAINKNRDIYRQQWPHYAGTATDEKSSASRLNDQGMGGYLLQDEGGLSFAINDPNSVKIIKKYAEGGSIREGYAGKGRVVGDIVDQALKLVAGEGEEAAKTGIRAYHGSPHDFDKFDMSKIGTGEGAQAYGHGLYFADREGIARSYRDALATGVKPEFRPTDKYSTVGWKAEAEKLFPNDRERQAAFHLFNQMKNKDYVLENHDFITSLPHNQGKPYEWEGVEFTRDRLAQLADEFYNPGHMYEVNIAADPNTFLDWDKPLSEQPEFLDRLATSKSKYARELLALPDLKSPTRNVYGTDIGPMTGQDAFKNLAIATTGKVTGGPKTTELLNKAGIPGIKYLDAGSRGKGVAQVQVMYKGKPHGDPIPVQAWNQVDQLTNDYKAKGYDVEVQDLGTRNYVVFDDKLISIIRKYGIAGASAMLGYNLMENLDANQAQAATVADKEYQATQPEVRGGMLPPGMEPSGEMTSRTPSASERIYDYVRSVLGGDEATKGQRAETVMNIIDQTPLAAGPMAYDIGRGIAEKVAYADGGAVDDDITDAIRIAKDVGGGTTPVMLEDAKGNKYDAQGNLIPPTAPGPAPARTPTPQEIGQRAANDPATFDALMQQYAVPDRDIAQYEATKAAVSAQPYETQQMTHVGEKPRREVTVDMPLFGGEYSLGTAPYDAASGMGTLAQTAYDWKTAPFYAIPLTAPLAAGMDVAEGVATEDPLTASLAIGFGPGGKYAKAAGIGAVNYFMDPSEAEAGPARWFSKAMEVANALPMEKMTGPQALAMLRKGVSPEELRWTGADVFLSTTPKISKEELIDYLNNNRFQTEDLTLGGNKPTSRKDVKPTPTASAPYMEEWNRLKAEDEKLNAEFDLSDADKSVQGMENFWRRQFEIDEQKDALREKMIDATIAEMGGLGLPVQYGPGSRYGDMYVTRGGEAYGEDLYKMPNAMKAYNLYVKKLREKYGEGALGDMPLTVSERGTLDNLMEAGGDNSKVYTSGHFPQYPGYLAHSRSQILDVEPPGANRPYKAWNVEEAQSDLAKSGRKSGFYDPVVYQKWANEYYANEKTIEQLRDNLKSITDRVSEVVGPEPKNWRDPAWNGYHTRRQEALDNNPEVNLAREALNDAIARGAELDAAIPNTSAAPIGPFVKSMEGWSKLTIKKQLDKALDSGADYFTWTPGEAQAQRYSLSKVADRITYNPPFVSPSGKQYSGRIVATKNGSAVFEKNGVTPDKLPEFIGEELASKLLKNKEVIESGKFEGLERYSVYGDEMKFGGEGMRKYYDSAFVKYVQDVFKEATGEKPKIEVITAQTADGPRQQLGIRLTEEMRENARFSDFNKGGRVTGSTKYADSDTVSRALALTSEV